MLAIIVASSIFTLRTGQAQRKGATPLATPQMHFFTHGFLAKGSDMQSVATDMGSINRFDWYNASILPDYSSLFVSGCGIACLDQTPLGVTPQLKSFSAAGAYVGLGWSTGGLIARYEALTDGYPFIMGLVTTHTPNDGVWIADYGARSVYLFRHTNNEIGMHRGDMGFLYFVWLGGGGIALVAALQAILQAVNFIGTAYLGGVANDLAPGSSFLNNLNSSPPPPNIPEVVLFGSTQWPYCAFYNGDPSGNSWLDAYSGPNGALSKSHQYDQTASAKLSDIKAHWYNFVEWPEVWWNRSRAGDWSATAGSMVDDEVAWEDATMGYDYGGAHEDYQSDGLLSLETQNAVPNAKDAVEDSYFNNDGTHHNVNHGGSVFDGDKTVRDHIQTALTDAGAIFYY